MNYTFELFPVNDEARNIYVNNLHSIYPKYTILNDGSIIFYRNNDNAGVDLWTANTQGVNGTEITLLDLGVRARMSITSNIPNRVHYWLAPRSSIWKYGVTQANSIGVIDKTYRGNLMGAVLAIDKTLPITIPQESRLFQVLAPDMGNISRIIVQPLSALDETSRGTGGFGSTG